MKWSVAPLAATHERQEFCCGVAQLDEYLRKYARQQSRKNFGRTFVAVQPGSNQVSGYYTLSASAVDFTNVPPGLQKKLPRYPLPTALIGKLAVDRAAQGQQLGEFLLIDALNRIVQIADQMAIFAVEVHAITPAAVAFYSKYGFEAFQDQPMHLFLPIATIRALF